MSDPATELAAADQAVLGARELVSRALTDRAGDPYTPERLALIAGRYAVEARAWSRLGYALGRAEVSQAVHLAVWTAHTQAVGFSRDWRRRTNRLAAELRAETDLPKGTGPMTTRRDALARAMTVRPVTARQGPCRCTGRPHHLDPSCYRPGRAPLLWDGLANLSIMSTWDLEARLAEAHAEGYGQAEADAEDAGMVASGEIVAALAKVRTSAAVRRALADVLGVQESQLGKVDR